MACENGDAPIGTHSCAFLRPVMLITDLPVRYKSIIVELTMMCQATSFEDSTKNGMSTMYNSISW